MTRSFTSQDRRVSGSSHAMATEDTEGSLQPGRNDPFEWLWDVVGPKQRPNPSNIHKTTGKF